MGRKKRKADSTSDDADENAEAPANAVASTVAESVPAKKNASTENKEGGAPARSGYAVTSHSGEIIQEDIYVSDGSIDSDDEDEIEVVLAGSRMGIMRRGLHQLTMLQQPNRQWTRQAAVDGSGTDGAVAERAAVELTEEEKRRQEEEELAKLDPAQRSARLFQEKQRKIEEAKEEARQKENEENATGDPSLFSKRTAFDIRFDSMDEKPWTRSGDISDFFNYGMAEDDWLEYAQQQLIVRQELIDSARQKRPPDQTIIPIQPRIASTSNADLQPAAVETMTDSDVSGTAASDIGPTIKSEDSVVESRSDSLVPIKEDEDEPFDDPYDNVEGGAWGAGAPPDSLLAKLIKEQEQVSESNKKNSAEVANQSIDSQQQQPPSARKEELDNTSIGDHNPSDHDSAERNGSERRLKVDYEQQYIPPQQYSNSYHDRNHYDYPEDPRERRPTNDGYYGSSRSGWKQPDVSRERRPPPPPGGWQQPAMPHHDHYSAPPPGRGGSSRGRGPWDAGRGSGDYHNSNNWKRSRDGSDSRYRR